MDPVTIGLLVVALLAAACSTSDPEEIFADGGDPIQDPYDGGVDADTDTESDTIIIDPGREGVNNSFSKPVINGYPVTVIDMDIDRAAYPNTIWLMGGHPTNYMGEIDVEGDPMESQVAAFGAYPHNFVGANYIDESEIHPLGLARLANDLMMVNSETGMLGDVGFLSFIDPDTGSMEANVESKSVHEVTFATTGAVGNCGPLTDGALSTYGATTGVIHGNDIEGYKLYVAAARESDARGIVLGYELDSDGVIVTPEAVSCVMTGGQEPVAMEDLGEGMVAVLNRTSAVDAAVINVVDLGAQQLESFLQLPFESAAPISEIAMTADKGHALVAGGTGASYSSLVFIDMSGSMSVVDSMVIHEGGDIRSIDILDLNPLDSQSRAFVSYENVISDSSIGKVAIIDLDPEAVDGAVVVDKTIEIGHDVGSVAVHSSGIFYVAVTDTEVESGEARWCQVVSVDESEVTDFTVEL